MNPSEHLYSELRASGLDFFVSVPCKFLANLLRMLEADRNIFYSPVAREEEGVGIAFGAYLAGRYPAVVMQNSGFGNSINAILSLLNYYRVPVVFVVSHRGTEGEPVEAQRMVGTAITDLLRVIRVEVLNVPAQANLTMIRTHILNARRETRSVAILLPIEFWTLDR